MSRPPTSDADNGSDHDTGVAEADADESGYRRDDYWRAAQEGRSPSADEAAEAYRQREAARSGGDQDGPSTGDGESASSTGHADQNDQGDGGSTRGESDASSPAPRHPDGPGTG